MKLLPWHWIAMTVVTAILVVMAPSDNESAPTKGAQASKHPISASTPTSSTEHKTRTSEAGRVELERLPGSVTVTNQKIDDAFNIMSWYEAPPTPKFVAKPVAEGPPPVVVPTAPPLPFTYLGRYGDADSRTIILSKGDRVYTVVVGDVIENTYRLEKASVSKIDFTYLPLNVEQSLRTGETL